MTSEIYWLTATIVATGLFALPYVIDRTLRVGLLRALGNPGVEDDAAMAPWAQRAKRAHANACENLVLFAPAVLAVHVAGLNNAITATACIIYFASRVVHFVAFTAGVPGIRTLAHLGGLTAIALLASRLFGLA